MNDRQLLDEFAKTGSQASFETLVQRHIDLVIGGEVLYGDGPLHRFGDSRPHQFSRLRTRAPPRLSGDSKFCYYPFDAKGS